MGVFLDENKYPYILNELYVGETPFVKKFIETLSDARKPYVGKPFKPVTGNSKDIIKLGDMLAKEFGFYSIALYIMPDSSMNACTVPVTLQLDKSISKTKPNFVKQTGFKYDPALSQLSIMVMVTAGTWFSEKLTDREVAAAIFHEIGHSFATQSEVLIPFMEAQKTAKYIQIIHNLFKQKSKLDSQGADTSLLIPSAILSMILTQTSVGARAMDQGLKNMTDSRNESSRMLFNLSEFISFAFNQYNKEVGALLKTKHNPFKYDYVNLLASVVKGNIVDVVFREPARAQELLSDSFATMYGLGPDLSSFLSKLTYDPSASGSIIATMISKIPVIGAAYNLIDLPFILISHFIDAHPSLIARLDSMLNELNTELKDPALSPKMKEAIKENIKEVEKIKEECMAPPTSSTSKFDGETVKRLWNALIAHLYNNRSITKPQGFFTNINKRKQLYEFTLLLEDDIFCDIQLI